ncbi:MAG TPA: hypothetical protein PLD10_14035 [Rhodopila sp.]|nr:hypothetical protein [Rhodopila sp.]
MTGTSRALARDPAFIEGYDTRAPVPGIHARTIVLPVDTDRYSPPVDS